MTVYAIANNLLSPLAGAACVDPIWTLISPAGILQGGNPYFVPDFASRFEARTAMALRIGKLGKGIAPRFAHRYVEAVAPATVFVAADLLERLCPAGLPWSPAVSYDRCLAIGRFRQIPFESIAECGCTLTLRSASAAEEAAFSRAALEPTIEETIAAVSMDNTLKTGDLILVGLAGDGPAVRPGMTARLSLDGEESLRFNIR